MGTPISVRIVAEDSSGQPSSTFNDAVTVGLGANPTGAALSGTRTVAATNGVATFTDLSINKAGTGYTLTASAPSLAGATSLAFSVTTQPPPPRATHLVFTVQPTNAAPFATIQPPVEVTALDDQNNPVTTFTDVVTIAIGKDGSALGTATLSGTKQVAAVNGVARFGNLSIDQVGTGYTLKVSASGLTGAESASFNVGVP